MESKNICKFVAERNSDTLTTDKFILESDREQMNCPILSDCDRMILVCTGKGRFVTDHISTAVSVGTLLFALAGWEYRIEYIEDLSYMYIDYRGGRVSELHSRFGVTPFSCVFGGFEELVPIWKESLVRADSGNIDLLSESMLLYAFSRLSVGERGETGVLGEILRYIDEHFTDHELTLGSMADELGYNEKYLSHLFKQKTNVGFSEYLKTVRIRHAALLMDQGMMSVKNVALLSGFTDPLYFSNVFFAASGIRPTEYIRKRAEQQNGI